MITHRIDDLSQQVEKIFDKKCSWGLKTGGGGGGWKISNFFSLLNIFRGGGGGFWGSRRVGKRYTSSYDHDMWPVKILERSGLAVKNYHPESLAAEE